MIPSKNGGTLLGLVLERIFGQQAPWPFEVVVVDSGSNAESLEILGAFPFAFTPFPPRCSITAARATSGRAWLAASIWCS